MTQDVIIETADGRFVFAPKVAGDVPQLVRPQRDRSPGRFAGTFAETEQEQATRWIRNQHEQYAGRCSDARLAVEYQRRQVEKASTQLQAASTELTRAQRQLRVYVRELRELEYKYGGVLQAVPKFPEEPFE